MPLVRDVAVYPGVCKAISVTANGANRHRHRAAPGSFRGP